MLVKILYHSNSFTRQDVLHVEHAVIGHVGQEVDDGDNGHRNADGEGQVPTAKQADKRMSVLPLPFYPHLSALRLCHAAVLSRNADVCAPQFLCL